METKVKLIGLSGRKRVGKDLAADYLWDMLISKPYRKMVERVAFAEGVKFTTAAAMGLPRGFFLKEENKTLSFRIGGTDDNPVILTGREILQKVGTECFRETLCQDFWVYNLMTKISMAPGNFFIITDVRFIEEVEAIEAAGGIVIRLLRHTGIEDNHPSETSLDNHPFKYFIDNSTTKKDLYKKLETLIKGLDI